MTKLPSQIKNVDKEEPPGFVSCLAIAELVVDVWKIGTRAAGQEDSGRVLSACERAMERAQRIGFTVEDPSHLPYDTNMKVRVVEHDFSDGPPKIAQCLSPAIYFRGDLVREAEVITEGGGVQ